MHKLFKLMFLFLFVAAACFMTGCGNTSDDWGKRIDDSKPLFVKIGIRQPALSNTRAAAEVPSVIVMSFGLNVYNLTKNLGVTDPIYYSGFITKAEVENVKAMTGKLTYGTRNCDILGSFLSKAFDGGKEEPNVYVEMDSDFIFKSATRYGETVSNPEEVIGKKTNKVVLSLSEDKNTIKATFDSVGEVKSFDWTVKIDDITEVGNKKSYEFHNGSSRYFSVESYSSTNFVIALTPEGQNELKGRICNGILASASAKLFNGSVVELDCSDPSCFIDNYRR